MEDCTTGELARGGSRVFADVFKLAFIRQYHISAEGFE